MKPKVCPRRKKKGNLDLLKRSSKFKAIKGSYKSKSYARQFDDIDDNLGVTHFSVSSDTDNSLNTRKRPSDKGKMRQAMRRERLLRNGFGRASTRSESSNEDNSNVEFYTPNTTFNFDSDSSMSADEALPEYGTTKDVFADPIESDASSVDSDNRRKSSGLDPSSTLVCRKKEKLSPVDKTQKRKSSSLPIAFSSYKTNSVVLILKHPMDFPFRGQMCVRAISGSVEILGYTLDPKTEDFVCAYSVEMFGALEIKTKYAEKKNTCHWKRVKSILDTYMPNQVVNQILVKCDNSSVILLLKSHDLSYAVDFAYSYIPMVKPKVSIGIPMLRNKGFSSGDEKDDVIQMSLQHEAVAEIIKQVAVLKVTSDKPAPCTMVYGARGYGKSTSLQYFVNKMLSSFQKVYYLDVDPGQSEFTPPGCVSLIEVTKPLLGPSFTHPKSPVKMAFYGNLTIDCLSTFIACIAKVVDFYRKNFIKYPLFINTFGWIEGLGLQTLDNIRSLASPMIEVFVTTPEDSHPVSEIRKAVEEIIQIATQDDSLTYEFKISCDRNYSMEKSKIYKPLLRRKLSILSYFGRCQDYFSPLQTMNTLKPYCLRIEDVVLHVIHPIFDKYILQAINCGFVALCIVDDSQILENVDNKHEHKRLVPDADFSECVGFGFVRAIDLEKNLLYLVTPESYEVVKQVNALVKGNIQMPNEVFEKQKIVDKPLPYVRQMLMKKSDLTGKLRKKAIVDKNLK